MAWQPSRFTRIAILYTSMRLGIFVVALVVLFFAGLRSILLVAVALVVSGLLSYPLARRQRDELTEAYAERRAMRERR